VAAAADLAGGGHGARQSLAGVPRSRGSGGLDLAGPGVGASGSNGEADRGGLGGGALAGGGGRRGGGEAELRRAIAAGVGRD